MTLRVLIVDDNQDGADSEAALVRSWGHEALVTYDALHAFEVATWWCPDVALIDLIMPGENGISLAERLRSHPSCKEATLVAVTAITGSAREAAMRWFDDYLIKPVDPNVLSCRLQSISKRRTGPSSLRPLAPSSKPRARRSPRNTPLRLPRPDAT